MILSRLQPALEKLRPAAWSCAAVLFLLNAWICQELFTTEFNADMYSIESAHITLARWVAEHPSGLSWFPLWYGGTPFLNTYPPVGPYLTGFFSLTAGSSPALAYHVVTALAYCLGPVFLFVFVRVLSGSLWPSFLAALVYSVYSPSTLLLADLARDVGTPFGARRLQALLRYGEGPHIIALTLIPLALAALCWASRKPGVLRLWLAALAVASVPLTNWIGAFAFATAVLVLLLSLSGKACWRIWLLFATVGALAYALASPWIPPSSVFDLQHNAQDVVGSYPMGADQYIYCGVLFAIGLLCYAALRLLRASRVVQFAAVYFVLMAGLTVSRPLYGTHAVPQPERFHLEMEMAVVVLVVFALHGLARRLPSTWKTALVVVVCLGIVFQSFSYRNFARHNIRSGEIEKTVEYQVAAWFRENLPGGRIFATGSTKFWLNVFTDNSQLGGAADQSITNLALPHVLFGIPFTEDNGEETVAWLRAYGIDAVVVGGPGSRDVYRDFHDPGKFDDVLTELWRDGDDVIYEVPRRSRSLAHVIRPGDVVLHRPPDFTKPVELLPYVEAMEDPSLPAASLVWHDSSDIAILTEMDPEQVLSVQITWHPNWSAVADGRRVPLRRDGLGQMIVEPGCNGPCEISLSYDPGLEMIIARTACVLVLLLPPLIALRRRQSPAHTPAQPAP